MPKQLALLEENGPEGFQYLPDFLSNEEELILLSFVQTLDWENIHMHGVIAKRKVVHFGMDYSYDTRRVSPTTPAPPVLTFLIDRAAKVMKVKPEDLKEILISYYPVGAPIGWHRDAPMFESVFGVSLGNECVMKFRSENESFKKVLEPRAAYVIQGPARWNWQHHIPAVKEERYSITFRTLNNHY